LWTHLGKLFARQGLSDRAIDAYKAALALDPEQQDAEQGLHLLEPAGKPNANKA
jgi:cytochrome c-type biogenesis protein CcmH/NrfG